MNQIKIQSKNKESPLEKYSKVGRALAVQHWTQDERYPTTINSIRVSPTRYQIYFVGPQVLFQEFGAGITYSAISHPTGRFGPGTFPSLHPERIPLNWENPAGWFYEDEETGTLVHTFGNPAQAEAYNTAQALRRYIQRDGGKIK